MATDNLTATLIALLRQQADARRADDGEQAAEIEALATAVEAEHEKARRFTEARI